MYMAKQRTQLYLEDRQQKILKQYSRSTGKSVGQLVREAVDQVYMRQREIGRPFSKDDPIWNFIGRGRSGRRDISVRHDEYLYLEKK